MSLNLPSLHTLTQTNSNSNKIQTLEREANCSRDLEGVRCKWASGRNRKIRMGNTVSLRGRAVPFPAHGKLISA